MATRTISTKLAIEGESQYKQAVASCNAELSALKSNLALVESEFRGNANSMDALTAKASALGAVYEKQLEKVTKLEAALLNAKQAQKGYDERISIAQSNIERCQQTLERLRQSTGNTAKEQEVATKELDKWTTELQAAEAGQKAAERGVQSWQKQLNNAKIDLNGLSDAIAQNDRYIREAAESADGCATSIDRFGKEVKGAGESSEKFAGGTQQAKEGIDQLAAALAAAGIAKSVKEIASELMACSEAAGAFETGLAKLSTLVDGDAYSMEDIKAELTALSNDTGIAAGALAEAAYQARSAGVDVADMIDFVGTATKTSAAGFTDSATAVNVLTTAINAYKLEGSDAEKVASMLVKTQDEGKTSVGELAQNMGRVIPVASAYNVSLGNLTTSYALLTKGGTNTSIATTNLAAMLVELGKDGSAVADILQEQTGHSFAQLMANGRDLGGVLDILLDSVEGDATAFSNLWSSTTAGQAALSLANSGAEEFTRTLGLMETSSGAVERNFRTMANTTESAQQRMANAANNLRIAIGDQLNPALVKLTETGAGAFAWATEFVEENPWVVSAVTGVTVAVGALTLGVGGLAAAPAVIGALNTALGLLAANPVVGVTAAVVGLTVAIGTWAASMGDADESTQEFTSSLRETKEAYDELTASMAKEQASTDSVAAALKKLLAAEAQSASQKDSIKQMVAQLNEAVPGLALSYDEMTGSINMTTEALDAQLARAAAQEEYQAQVDRLTQLYVEQEEIAARLEEAQEQLTEAEEESAGAANLAASSYAAASGAHLEQNTAAGRLRGTIEALTAAEAENAAQIAALEGETAAYAQQQAEAALATETMAATVDGLIVEMEALQQSYQESYDAAWKSIDGQLGMFNELDGTAKTSIDSLIETLEGQVKYMDDYAANIQRAMELGVDEGLIRKLSDGSQESAQILDAIVKGGEEDIQTLNQQLARVQEGKESFSNAVAQMETEFDKKMGELVKDLNDAVEEMDVQEDAYKIGVNNVQGLLDGTASQRSALVEAYAEMGRASLAAYKLAVDQHSPSKEFEKAGQNDAQGVINGAEAKKAELSAAYENLAKVALEGYADGVYKNLDEVEQALATLETALKSVDSFYSTKSDVSSLQYQLWERTDGKWASDTAKYAKKLEMLTSQQEDQKTVVEAAEAAYEAVVAQYGAASEESYNLQKTLLEEKLAYQDLLDTIQQVNNAKSEAFAAQEAARWSSGGYGGYLPGYEDAAQAALLGMATHLPSVVEAPATSAPIDRQLELVAASINAISDAAGIAHTTPSSINLMTPDGKVMASWLLDPLAGYADANGTPIINPS